MKSFEIILPQVRTYFFCISLKTGCLHIGIICLVFIAYHIYFITDQAFLSNKSAMKAQACGALMIASHILFAIFNIILIHGVFKESASEIKMWLYGAMQNAVFLLLTGFIASPLFYKRNSETGNIENTDDALKQWPITIIFSVVAFVEFYFMIVVISYYVEAHKHIQKTGENVCHLCHGVHPDDEPNDHHAK